MVTVISAYVALDGGAVPEFNRDMPGHRRVKYLFLLIYLFVPPGEIQQRRQHVGAVLMRWQHIPEFGMGHQLFHRPRR